MQTETKTKKIRLGWLPILIGTAIALTAMVALGFLLRQSLTRDQAEAPAIAETTPEPTEIVYTLETYAAEHGYQLSDYPEPLLELYDKNPEARQFVMEYPLYKDESPEIDLHDDYTAGEVPLLFQWDRRWGYRTYNQNFMARTGCGPTCLSMAIIGLTGNVSCNPWALAQYAEEHNFCVPGSGTVWEFIPDCAEYFGVHAQVLGLSESAIRAELDAGHLVIVVVGPGDFTDNGHFLLLTGVENGLIRIHDPYSPRNSELLWTYERLASQIKGLWTLYT